MIVAVVLQLVGLLLVATAAWFVHPGASLAVVGAASFAAGYERERRR